MLIWSSLRAFGNYYLLANHLIQPIKVFKRNLINEGFQSPKALANTGLSDFFNLLPLDCSAGLGCEIVEHAVDAGHLRSDAGGDMLQQREGNVLNGGSHRVGGIDRAEDDGIRIGTHTVLHADGTEVGNRR